MKSRVSIIVPVYNVEKYLGACLTSLTKQTLKDIEIICIDDGSTDKSSEILDKYQKEDSRIKVIRQENKGRSVARNVGIKESNSPYLMFCDADDTYDLTMCEKMLDAIEKNKTDLVVCGINMIYEVHHEMRDSDEYYYRVKFDGRRLINDNIILETNGSACNKIFKADILKKYNIAFPEGVGTAEDFYFYSAYMSVSKTIFFLRQKLYNYVRREGSQMSENFNKNKLSTDDLSAVGKLFDFYKETGFIKTHKNLFWHQWTASFWTSYRYSEKKYRKKVLTIGKDFIEKNYEKYKPSDCGAGNKVNEIKNFNNFVKIKTDLKELLKKIYLKFNYSYRQMNYISTNLDDIYWSFVGLSERADDLIKEEK